MLIYRAYIPGRSQDGVEQCYIGKTVQSLKERYNQHRRSANISKEEEKGKAGKLHKTMWAEGDKVHFEKIYDAKDAHELAKKEREFVLQFKSKEFGWNIVVPSGEFTPNCNLKSIFINKEEIIFDSYKDLIRVLSDKYKRKLSYSTLRFYLVDIIDTDDPQQIEEACLKTIRAADETAWRERSRNIFGKEVSGNHWARDIIADRDLNRNGLTLAQLRARLDGNDDEESIEQALKNPPKFKKRTYNLTFEDRPDIGPYQNVPQLLNALKADFPNQKFPRDTTVNTNLSRGYSLLQAVGLSQPPWRSTDLWKYTDKLIDSGFKLEGEIRPNAQPLVSHNFQIIFASIKDCANNFNFDYTTLCEKLKIMDLDEYLHEKNRVPKINQAKVKNPIN